MSPLLEPLQLPRLSGLGIVKRWPRVPRPLLDQVDLELQPGESVSLVGRNGIGKTTLLRIAAGLIWPDAGDVHLDDLHPQRDRRHYQRSIGFLSAGSGGLYARFTTRQQLDYWARLVHPAPDLLRHLLLGTPLASSPWSTIAKLVAFLPFSSRCHLTLQAALQFAQRHGTAIEY